jgi:hypothetical protein
MMTGKSFDHIPELLRTELPLKPYLANTIG